METKMNCWVAVDDFGVSLWKNKPYWVEGVSISHWTDKDGPNSEWYIPKELFPDLTRENSPIEIELTFRRK